MTSRSSSFLVLVAFALGAFGCALTPRGLAHDVASASPPAAIHSTLAALNDADNQRLMVQLLDSPQMHQAARAFAGEIADGTLAAMTEPERLARIEEMSTRYVATLTRAISRSMSEGLRRDLGPAIAQVMRETVTTTMRQALSESYQHDMERVAAGLTRATVEAASRGMAEGVTRDIAPAMRNALLDPETMRALGIVGRSMTREVVLGGNDAITQLQRQQERGQTTFLGRLTSATSDGLKALQWTALAVGAVAVLLALWVVRLIMKSRKLQAESESHAASAVMFAEAIRAAEGKPWAGELTDLLRKRLKGDEVDELMARVLGRPPTEPRRPTDRPSYRDSLPVPHGT